MTCAHRIGDAESARSPTATSVLVHPSVGQALNKYARKKSSKHKNQRRTQNMRASMYIQVADRGIPGIYAYY